MLSSSPTKSYGYRKGSKSPNVYQHATSYSSGKLQYVQFLSKTGWLGKTSQPSKLQAPSSLKGRLAVAAMNELMPAMIQALLWETVPCGSNQPKVGPTCRLWTPLSYSLHTWSTRGRGSSHWGSSLRSGLLPPATLLHQHTVRREGEGFCHQDQEEERDLEKFRLSSALEML